MRVSLRENPQLGLNNWATTIPEALLGTAPAVVYCATGLLLVLIFGVVLPAVWSRYAARRRDARHTLDRLVRLLRRPE
ncbi:hypothetical protein Acor_57900 [Acrocarpospora corrugata]|uniref:Uncharacterized protein n=1 Tax=Acrocarpospora corrugata TaxID=35763 RepID=A0A5M3W4M7_9ACTN|nr:hypothetical protein [Acrocarpospora corrugata]GES03724.1 hypothetical protein Acor_57900 [Acrocarpospora corrugata]